MKMLIIAPSNSSFIHKDHQILSELGHTRLEIVWSMKQILRTCFLVMKYDTCIFWFASIRFIPIFLVAKLTGKKTYAIAGGYDVSIISELNYGGVRPSSPMAFFRKKFLSGTDKLITVSDSNTLEAQNNANVPAFKTQKIYLGFDLPNIQLTPWRERKNQVVFIACCDETSFKIKGFSTFLELARSMPHIQFIHIGKISVREFKEEALKIPNIILRGYVKNLSEEFSQLLNQTKIILLPSKIESFGASVVEGGLHGCVPVTSHRYALPEIAGKMGRICQLDHPEDFKCAINEITQTEDLDVRELQDYYFKRFNTANRKEAFKKLFNT